MDSSAAAKLLLQEDESAALEAAVGGCRLVASALLRTELVRATRRHLPEPGLLFSIDAVVRRMDLIPVDASVLASACNVDPRSLRTLDAIHLASAMMIQPELDAFVTYDRQLAKAAAAAGFRVESPA